VNRRGGWPGLALFETWVQCEFDHRDFDLNVKATLPRSRILQPSRRVMEPPIPPGLEPRETRATRREGPSYAGLLTGN